jgi:hypothetical protein
LQLASVLQPKLLKRGFLSDPAYKKLNIMSIKDGSFFGFSESIEAPKVGASSFMN